ncbi:MAG: histidine--tRNA ligase [Acidimicrobiales bacterium]
MPESPPFKAPIGTRDVLPPESSRWIALLSAFARHAEGGGYGLVETPMLEDAGVFQRVGEGTDIVRKEMYDFEDKGGRRLALRPEVTASVVRAFVQHRPATPWKVWTVMPCFRYEAPQAGRFRQHHQVDIEIFGTADPDADVEVIAVGHDYLRRVGLRRVTLLLNSMGASDDRRAYIERLGAWLEERADRLDPDDRAKVAANPMRVLDSKRKATREVTRDAPRILDHLSAEARQRFERVQQGLGDLDIDFILEPRLVRGLDYYTHTTFEFVSEALDTAQSTLLGGGRYDGLVAEMGGPPTPAIGWGSGIERVLLACDAEGVFPAPERGIDVFVVDVTGGAAARAITAHLRREGIRVDRAWDDRSMKAQMRRANVSGARLALIVGEKEVAESTVSVRDLRVDGAEQETVERGRLVEHVRKILEG